MHFALLSSAGERAVTVESSPRVLGNLLLEKEKNESGVAEALRHELSRSDQTDQCRTSF